MNRKPFTPQAGTSYRNQGGGNFVCIAATEQNDVFIMRNQASGWTFNAHGVGIYDDDSIDWNYSTDGHFESVSGQQALPCPQDVFRNTVQTWGKEAQTDMMIEEMAELTKEILNERRGRDHNIAEEMADVQIMLAQMEIIFKNAEEVGRIFWEKIARLDQRLKERQERRMNEEKDVRICPVCEREVERAEMDFTRDCHGILFRLVCWDCYGKLMSKGYDGEYYDELDEQIEPDY